MEDRLKPCPFCGGEDVKILYFTSVLCRGICNVCGASGHVSEVPAEAIEQWNCRAPLYSPVKPEDVTPGWYWAVSQSGVVTVCEAMGHSLFFIRKESMIFSEYSVKTILDRGYTLYRIPELEVSE